MILDLSKTKPDLVANNYGGSDAASAKKSSNKFKATSKYLAFD